MSFRTRNKIAAMTSADPDIHHTDWYRKMEFRQFTANCPSPLISVFCKLEELEYKYRDKDAVKAEPVAAALVNELLDVIFRHQQEWYEGLATQQAK